jgi:hypothetical protein
MRGERPPRWDGSLGRLTQKECVRRLFLAPKIITEETAAPDLRGWCVVTTALSFSSLYSPVAAVKVVLPRELHLDRRACGESHSSKSERAVEPRSIISLIFPFLMSRDICDVDVDSDIETGMNLAALQYDLKLCREHGTYIDLKTLAFAIHHVLQDDTEALIAELSACVTGKRE